MQIETYEIEEITSEAGNMAADAECAELIEQLGLEGQRKLMNPETLTRVPYPKLTALQRVVFETLFPNKTKIGDYSEGIIPLRVMQVVAFCKEGQLFDEIRVWHPEPGMKDPVLIGSKKDTAVTWGRTDEFLLARWGDALESFESLTEKAKKKWLTVHSAKLKAVVIEANGDLAAIEATAEQVFATGNAKTFSYYA